MCDSRIWYGLIMRFAVGVLAVSAMLFILTSDEIYIAVSKFVHYLPIKAHAIVTLLHQHYIGQTEVYEK